MEKLTVAYRIFRTRLKPVSSQEHNLQPTVGNKSILIVLYSVMNYSISFCICFLHLVFRGYLVRSF